MLMIFSANHKIPNTIMYFEFFLKYKHSNKEGNNNRVVIIITNGICDVLSPLTVQTGWT